MAIHVVPLEQIILITTNQSLLFFLSGRAANTNFIVFDSLYSRKLTHLPLTTITHSFFFTKMLALIIGKYLI
jgi:hypothetical protein